MKSGRLALEEINLELTAAKSAITEWSDKKKNSALKLNEIHLKCIKDNKERIIELEKEHDAYISKAVGIQEKLQEEKVLEEELQTKLKLTECDLSTTEKKFEELKVALEQKLSLLNEKQAALKVDREFFERELMEKKKCIKLFEDRLGLKFITPDEGGQLICSFSHLDNNDPQRKCEIVISIHSQSIYEVIKTTPSLEDVNALTSDLNKTGEFGKFLCSVRAKFIEYLNS